jgi:hypothetical protein
MALPWCQERMVQPKVSPCRISILGPTLVIGCWYGLGSGRCRLRHDPHHFPSPRQSRFDRIDSDPGLYGHASRRAVVWSRAVWSRAAWSRASVRIILVSFPLATSWALPDPPRPCPLTASAMIRAHPASWRSGSATVLCPVGKVPRLCHGDPQMQACPGLHVCCLLRVALTGHCRAIPAQLRLASRWPSRHC